MRPLAPTVALILGLVGLGFDRVSPPEIPSFARELTPIRSGPPVFSFNGKDLSGFYTFTRYHKYEDPDRVFSVHDGMVHVSGKEFGGFATVNSYSDYHLIVEWKWGGRTFFPRRYGARNSGVMVHAVGGDGEAFASWMASIECQILEGGSGDLIVVPGKDRIPSLTAEVRVGSDGQVYYQMGGEPRTRTAGRFNWWGRDPAWKDTLWFRGPIDIDHKVGEWNRMEIVCEGGSITYLLNGCLMNAASKASLTSGKILFQSEGAEIFFRKIEVRPLVK